MEPHAQAALFRSLVADRRVLVVVDNAVDTDQVEPLLPGGPRCAVPVTSRNQLTGLITGHGARHLDLDVLGPAEAHDLPATRLGDARLAADPGAVRGLVHHCGGFPLALSVVAGRAQTHPDLPLAFLAAELRESVLDAPDAAEPAASVPTVLSWSYRSLPPEQARVPALPARAPGPSTSLPAAPR